MCGFAGHINKNFVGNSSEGISSQRQAELKLIEVRGKWKGKWNCKYRSSS